MKRKLAFIPALALTAAALIFPACAKEDKITYGDYIFCMNTQATLATSNVTKEQYDEFYEKVSSFLHRAEQSLSATVTTSCTYAFNAAQAGEKVELDEIAYSVLSCAKEAYALTEGAYNPAVYYSVEAYGFLTNDIENDFSLPPAEQTAAYAELASHFGEIELLAEDGKYYAVKPSATVELDGKTLSLKIDLGGIGKGWCADEINKTFEQSGIEYGYFDFGSSTISVRKYYGNNDGNYTISGRDPRGKGNYYSIRVQDTALSSSGDHQNFFLVDGVRYCHIIDPFTGMPIRTGVASVSVYGGSAAQADALTTALSVMGKQKAVEYINAHLSDRKVVMLIAQDDYEDKGEIITNCPDEITVLNTNYKIANTVDERGCIVLTDVA